MRRDVMERDADQWRTRHARLTPSRYTYSTYLAQGPYLPCCSRSRLSLKYCT